ncbi:MAG: hypothetical protein V4581_13420 [Bacteroidota bacterium]
MLKSLLLLGLLLCMASCGTLNGGPYTVLVDSNVPNAKATIRGNTYSLPAEVSLPREKNTLTITLEADSVKQRDFMVKSRLSPNAIAGNLFYMPIYPVALGVDIVTGKGYYYGKYIYLDTLTNEAKVRGWWGRPLKHIGPVPRGRINLLVSIPYVNNFHQQPKNRPVQNSWGCFGIAAGLEYYYAENRSVKAMASSTIDFPFFVPVPLLDISEKMYSATFSLTHNYQMGRLQLGYGPAFTSNAWSWRRSDSSDISFDPDNPNKRSEQLINRSVGMLFTANYKVGKALHLGLSYNPSIYAIKPVGAFNYEHVISFEFICKFKMSKK